MAGNDTPHASETMEAALHWIRAKRGIRQACRVAGKLEDRLIDLTGLKCPGSIVAPNTEIRQITGGDQLEVLSDDPAFELDVKAWCRRTGHELMSVHALDGVFRARIRRKA